MTFSEVARALNARTFPCIDDAATSEADSPSCHVIHLIVTSKYPRSQFGHSNFSFSGSE